ncbi:MAG: hypothetical protein DHS80DRAFT_30010 [Piptocephalis tieghemiana]|nr:MAG: hypothetical protein DHS80DRAFT_30010 [Piptocephalis tieghemiana]
MSDTEETPKTNGSLSSLDPKEDTPLTVPSNSDATIPTSLPPTTDSTVITTFTEKTKEIKEEEEEEEEEEEASQGSAPQEESTLEKKTPEEEETKTNQDPSSPTNKDIGKEESPSTSSASSINSTTKSNKLSEALARARIIASKLTAEKANETAATEKASSASPSSSSSSSSSSHSTASQASSETPQEDKFSEATDVNANNHVRITNKKRPLDELAEGPGAATGSHQEGRIKASRSNSSTRPPPTTTTTSAQGNGPQNASYGYNGRPPLPTGPANHRSSAHGPYSSQDTKRFQPSSVNSTHLPRHHSPRIMGGSSSSSSSSSSLHKAPPIPIRPTVIPSAYPSPMNGPPGHPKSSILPTGPSHHLSAQQHRPSPGNISQEFTVPSIHVGKIIGKHGEMLRLIEGRSGCHIQFAQAYRPSDTDRRVTVTGRPDQVEEARGAIQRLLDDLASGRQPNPYPPSATPTVPTVPSHLSSTPYPSNPPQILPFTGVPPMNPHSMAPTGSSVNTDTPPPIGPLSSSSSSTSSNPSSSSTSQIPRSDAPPQPGEVRVQLAVPNHRVGLLIGKGGETIRELQVRSSARVHVQPDREMLPGQTERTVLVTGREEATAFAQQLIMEVVHHGKMSQVTSGAGGPGGGGIGEGIHMTGQYPNASSLPYGTSAMSSDQYAGTYGAGSYQPTGQYGINGAVPYPGVPSTAAATTTSTLINPQYPTSNDPALPTQGDGGDQGSVSWGRTISRVPTAGAPAGHITETLEVTNDAAGMVIGKGGETVRQLQTTSQARIQVEPIRQAVNGMRKIHVSGDEATVQYARQLIFAQVEARKRAGGSKTASSIPSTSNITPASYDSSMYGMYSKYSSSSSSVSQAGYPAYMASSDGSYMAGTTPGVGSAVTGSGHGTDASTGVMDPAALQQYYAAYYAAAAANPAASGGNHGQAPGTGGSSSTDPSSSYYYYSMHPGQ